MPSPPKCGSLCSIYIFVHSCATVSVVISTADVYIFLNQDTQATAIQVAAGTSVPQGTCFPLSDNLLPIVREGIQRNHLKDADIL